MARGDIALDIRTDGELMIQRMVLDAWRKSHVKDTKLIVFDVGGNIGDWSLELLNSIRGDNYFDLDLRVFEPVPSTYATLKKRIREHECGRSAVLESFALSAEEGETSIYIKGDNVGTNSLHPDPLYVGYRQLKVTITTAKNYCDRCGIQTIQLFKCDTEGHDLSVIKGALPLLKDGRIKVLQFEYNHLWIYARNYLKDAFEIINGLPYKLGKVQPNHIELIEFWHPELERFFEGNYVLLHQDAIPWFRVIPASIDKYNTLVCGRQV